MGRRRRLVDQVVSLDPRLLSVAHRVDRPETLEALTSAMERDGWKGRPIAVSKEGKRFFAWTGVHRVNAAIVAGLDSIPVIIGPKDLMSKKRWYGGGRYADLIRVDDLANRYVHDNQLDPTEFESWSPEFLEYVEGLGIHPEVVELLDSEFWDT